MENELKTFVQSKIDEYIEILQTIMTRDNTNVITYGDKLTALGGLMMAVSVMKRIDPGFRFDLYDYFPQLEHDKYKFECNV